MASSIRRTNRLSNLFANRAVTVMIGCLGAALGAPQLVLAQSNTTSVTDISNPDTYTCSQAGFIGFETLADGTNLPGTIAGLSFITTGGHPWLVGDFTTGNY